MIHSLCQLYDILSRVLSLLFNLPLGFYGIFLLKITAIFLAFRFLQKYRPKWQAMAYALLFIFTLRLLLFGNPVSWAIYKHLLGPGDIGRRQFGVIKGERYKYEPKPANVDYLAVGSSQTYAIYQNYAKQDEHFRIFSMPGLGPLEILLYRNYIKHYKPRHILLYLSEFDMAREPAFDAAKLAPAQRFYIFSLFRKLSMLLKSSEANLFFKELMVGEVLPEYKYAFVFRGITDKLMGKNEALGIRNITEISDREYLRIQLDNLGKNLKAEFIRINLALLRDFITFCGRENIHLIIVEGQYNPQAYTEQNRRMNRIVSRDLGSLASEFEYVTFLPRSAIFEFLEDDYRDGYHVKKEMGERFTKALIGYLESLSHDNA